VDSRRCSAFDRISIKKIRSLYLFLPSIAYDPEKRERLDRSQKSTKLYSTLFVHLLYEYSKRFVQPVVEPAAKCTRTFNVRFRDLQRPSSETSHATGSIYGVYVHPVLHTVGPVAALRQLHIAFHVSSNSREGEG